jgi:transposase
MRGQESKQTVLLPAISIESLVAKKLPDDHPLWKIKSFTDSVLKSLSPEFDKLYAQGGRPSIPPELLLRASLWQALFSIRSERLLVFLMQFDMLCRWFVGLPIDQDPWDHSSFSKARETLRLPIIAELFFHRHLQFLREQNLLSSDHLSVDGTLLEAWASHKSLVRRDELDSDGKPPAPPCGGRNGWVDFKGQQRSNETHTSVTDPDARLASKGTGAKLSHELNIVAENRNHFAVAFTVEPPTGTSEREAAYEMAKEECEQGRTPITMGGDRKYSDGDELVCKLADLGIVPHFSVRDDRPNALARMFHDDEFYPVSIQKRMKIEEINGFVKRICGLAKLKVRGTVRVIGVAAVALSGYNLTHQAHLSPA